MLKVMEACFEFRARDSQGAKCNWEEGNSGSFFALPSHLTRKMYCINIFDTPLTPLYIILQHLSKRPIMRSDSMMVSVSGASYEKAKSKVRRATIDKKWL